MRTPNELPGVPTALASTIEPLLRPGLVPAVVNGDLLILDTDANQVMHIPCADTTIDDITAVLDAQGLLATTPQALSRRRILQGAAAAGVVGVTVLTLPTAAMAASVGGAGGGTATTAPGSTTNTTTVGPNIRSVVSDDGGGATVTWDTWTGADFYDVVWVVRALELESSISPDAPAESVDIDEFYFVAGTEYEFFIIAYDVNGNSLGQSSSIFFTPKPLA
jgi:hypothetical protein